MEIDSYLRKKTAAAERRRHPEFHTLVIDAPLSAAARDEKQVLSRFFVDFIAARLRRELLTLSHSEEAHHGQVALMIFLGILEEFTTAAPSARPRLQRGMHDAILRYLDFHNRGRICPGEDDPELRNE